MGRKPTGCLPFHLASASCQQPIRFCLLPSIRWRRLNFRLQQTDPSASAWGTHNLTSSLLNLPLWTAYNDSYTSYSWRGCVFVAYLAKKGIQQKTPRERVRLTERGDFLKNSLSFCQIFCVLLMPGGHCFLHAEVSLGKSLNLGQDTGSRLKTDINL